MTHEEVGAFKERIVKLEKEEAAVKKSLMEIQEKISREQDLFQKKCDHRLPDGKSADNGGYGVGICRVCGKVFW